MSDLEQADEKQKKAVFGTKEWAEGTADCFKGCANDCSYCYAKAEGARFGRKDPATWTKPDPWPGAIEKALKTKPSKIMFPAHHDITMDNLMVCAEAMRKLLNAGHDLLVVSKPMAKCVMALCGMFSDAKDKILFRFTIGSANNATLLLWERCAPSFDERMASLIFAYNCGFKTSISCEPMLDNEVELVVGRVLPYVTDAVWIGKPNYLMQRLSLNKVTDPAVLSAAEKLLTDLSDERIWAIYNTYKDNEHVRWKESVKKIVGIEVPTTPGLDV
jgi:DNA repair photolyase